jgi:hypothetical protein
LDPENFMGNKEDIEDFMKKQKEKLELEKAHILNDQTLIGKLF